MHRHHQPAPVECLAEPLALEHFWTPPTCHTCWVGVLKASVSPNFLLRTPFTLSVPPLPRAGARTGPWLQEGGGDANRGKGAEAGTIAGAGAPHKILGCCSIPRIPSSHAYGLKWSLAGFDNLWIVSLATSKGDMVGSSTSTVGKKTLTLIVWWE